MMRWLRVWLLLGVIGMGGTLLGSGIGWMSRQLVPIRWMYRTSDGRCWEPFVPTTNAVEQPATTQQQAVKPMYAIHVGCP